MRRSKRGAKARQRNGGLGKRKSRRLEEEEEARATFLGRGEALDEEISSEEDEEDAQEKFEAVDPQEEAVESIEATRLRLARQLVAETRARVDDSSDEEEVAEALGEETRRRSLAGAARSASVVGSMKGHRGPVTCACLRGTSAVSGSKDNSVLEFDLESGKRTRTYLERWPARASEAVEAARGSVEGALAPRQSHEAEVLAVAANAEHLVAAGGRDKLIHVFDSRSSQPARSLRGHGQAVTALQFTEDGDLLSASEDGSVKVWRDGLVYSETLFGHSKAVRSLDCGRRPVTGGADATLRAWKLHDETHLVYRAHPGTSVDACFALSSDSHVSAGDDGCVSLWSAQRKKPVAIRRAAHGGPPASPTWLTALSGVRDSDLVASGASDGRLRLYDASDDLRPVLDFPCAGVINAIHATPDARHLLVAASHEHKFGRWIRRAPAPNALLLFRLTFDDPALS